jgi:hypothetical protein
VASIALDALSTRAAAEERTIKNALYAKALSLLLELQDVF